MADEKKGSRQQSSFWMEFLVILPQLMQVVLGLGQAGCIRGVAGLIFLFALLTPCMGFGIYWIYWVDGLVPAIATPILGIVMAGLAIWLWNKGGDVRDVEILEEIVDDLKDRRPAQVSAPAPVQEIEENRSASRALPQDIDGEFTRVDRADDTEI